MIRLACIYLQGVAELQRDPAGAACDSEGVAWGAYGAGGTGGMGSGGSKDGEGTAGRESEGTRRAAWGARVGLQERVRIAVEGRPACRAGSLGVGASAVRPEGGSGETDGAGRTGTELLEPGKEQKGECTVPVGLGRELELGLVQERGCGVGC